MAVFFKNNYWFVDWYPDGRYGKRERTKLPPTVKTKEEAEKWEKRLKSIKKKRAPSLSIESTIKEVFPLYLDCIETNRQPTTYRDVEIAGKHIIRHIGNVKLKNISKEHIELYKKLRKAECVPNKPNKLISHRTVNKELSWLSGFLTWCREEKDLPVNYFKIKKFKYKRPIPVILSVQEAVDLLMNASPFHRCFFGFLYLCGLRFGEARLLRWEQQVAGSNPAGRKLNKDLQKLIKISVSTNVYISLKYCK